MSLLRVLIIGSCAYAGLIFVLRLTGKRTLSKMNAFDLVVTVALGSTLATVLLSKDVSLAEGLLALTLLCLLQYSVAWLSVRSPRFEHIVKSEPSLLYYQGRYLDENLKKERVTKTEVIAAVRNQGIGSMTKAEAVVLETDGTFSVLQKAANLDSSLMKNIYRNVP